MTRYYLNNMTDTVIIINLTANRTIKPLTSLPLNDKDVEIYKKLKQDRAGIKSSLDDLVFSTIPIEKDSRYIQAFSQQEPQEKPNPPEKCKPCYAEGKTPNEKDCEACKAEEEQEKVIAEEPKSRKKSKAKQVEGQE